MGKKKEEVNPFETRDKILKIAIVVIAIIGFAGTINSAKNWGKIELCTAMEGEMATDGKCYQPESFKVWNETRMMTAMWYDPTKGTYPKINMTGVIEND